MDDYESLKHTRWECKYHIVFIPKCRRQKLYQQLHQHLGEVCHDRLVRYVDGMLRLHKDLAGVRTPREEDSLERQIASTDREIDRLVYELYGLTEEEIRIVEGTTQ